MRQLVESLRQRYQQCQYTDGSLESWRALQLEILDVAKKLQRSASEHEQQQEHAVRMSAELCTALWAMLGESFWLERDVARLARMVEGVIVVLERHEMPNSNL